MPCYVFPRFVPIVVVVDELTISSVAHSTGFCNFYFSPPLVTRRNQLGEMYLIWVFRFDKGNSKPLIIKNEDWLCFTTSVNFYFYDNSIFLVEGQIELELLEDSYKGEWERKRNWVLKEWKSRYYYCVKRKFKISFQLDLLCLLTIYFVNIKINPQFG